MLKFKLYLRTVSFINTIFRPPIEFASTYFQIDRNCLPQLFPQVRYISSIHLHYIIDQANATGRLQRMQVTLPKLTKQKASRHKHMN